MILYNIIQKQPGSVLYEDLQFDMPMGPMTFTELRMNGYLCYLGIKGDTHLYQYKGVHLRNGQVAEVGENVAFERHKNQVAKLNNPLQECITLII